MKKWIWVLGMCLALIFGNDCVLAAEPGVLWPGEIQHVTEWNAWDDYFEHSFMKWKLNKEEIKGNGIHIEINAAADVQGEYTEYGIWIWDAEGNLVYENREDFFTPREDLIVWYSLNGFAEESEYTYQFFVVYEGECYYSPFYTFETGRFV